MEEKAGTAVQKAGVVNDGGLSWLRKSYQRMKEQAEREQRSLSEVVSERYGSMEEFQQRLEEAEKAVYGDRRGGGEGSTRGGWRKDEEDKRHRADRSGSDRERWRRHDRDSSPQRPDRSRDRDRDRNRDREDDRHDNGHRARDRDRERERHREREGNRSRDEDRERSSSSLSSSGKDRVQQPLSLGSLKSRFLKPSDDDDMTAPQRAPPAKSSGFLRPSSDDEDSGPRSSRAPAWKKSSSTGQRPPEKHPEKKEADATTAAVPENTSQAVRDETISSSKSESESEEEEEQLPLLSEEEMNKLGAKLVKAELMGNTVMIEKLKSQLDSARKAKESHAARQKLQQDAALSLIHI